MVRKCPNCGKFIADKVLVCPQCGETLNTHGTPIASENNEISELRSMIDNEYRICKKTMNLRTSESSMFICVEKFEYPGGRITLYFTENLNETKDVSAFLKAKELVERFKQSPFFSEYGNWSEDIGEEHIFCCCNILKADVSTYIAEMLHYLKCKPTSMFESQGGCFGVAVMFILCGLSLSLMLLK